VAHLAGGAVAVVGEGVNQDGHAPRGVPLVDDLLVLLGALAASLELGEKALNVLHGHVVGPGGLNGVA
jgi:hypothetical protein